MEDFKRIDMYQCTWCGKIFRTNDRHRCKFRPSFENCFSCANCTGVDAAARRIGDYPDKAMKCAVREDMPIRIIAGKNWELHCPLWKLAEDYKGKETYVEKNVVPNMRRRMIPADPDLVLDDDDSLPF